MISIEIFSDLEFPEVTIKLMGLSILYKNGAQNLDLEILVGKNGDFQPQNIKESSLPKLLTANWLPEKLKGSFQISELELHPKIKGHLGRLAFKFSILNKPILPNEKILINLGQNLLKEDFYCTCTSPTDGSYVLELALCQKINTKEILIQFSESISSTDFMIVLQNVVVPQESIPGMKLVFIFNGGIESFSSDFLFYPETFVAANLQDCSVEVQQNGVGMKSTFKFYLTLNFSFQSSDVVFIQFGREASAFLGGNIFAYEENLGL